MIHHAHTNSADQQPFWMQSAARWLTLRRMRTQALMLALCLWGV